MPSLERHEHVVLLGARWLICAAPSSLNTDKGGCVLEHMLWKHQSSRSGPHCTGPLQAQKQKWTIIQFSPHYHTGKLSLREVTGKTSEEIQGWSQSLLNIQYHKESRFAKFTLFKWEFGWLFLSISPPTPEVYSHLNLPKQQSSAFSYPTSEWADGMEPRSRKTCLHRLS